MFGFTSTDGYTYTKSKAEHDGQFIGQIFDQKNQEDLSENRAVRSIVTSIINTLNNEASLKSLFVYVT